LKFQIECQTPVSGFAPLLISTTPPMPVISTRTPELLWGLLAAGRERKQIDATLKTVAERLSPLQSGQALPPQ
jgi:hypothetical protein